MRVIAIFNCLSFQPKKKRLCQIRHWGVSPLVYGWGHEVGHAYKLQVRCFYSAEFKNNVEVGLSLFQHYSIQDTIDSIDYMCID